MTTQFLLCDVFTDRPLSGNQLAVFLDADGISDGTMAALGREFGWSEITFVQWGGDVPRIRIWTPQGELPFAGHPTVGTAVALVASGRVPAGAVTLELGIGSVHLEVEVDNAHGGSATMTQRAPTFGMVCEDREGLVSALGLGLADLANGLPAQVVSTGLEHFMVPIASLGALQRARATGVALPVQLEGHVISWAYCFTTDTPGSNAAARARLLAPGLEDPATGSAVGPLGAYLVHYGLHRAGVIEVEQGIEMGRPSRLRVDVPVVSGEIGPIRVTGDVRIWGSGALEDLSE